MMMRITKMFNQSLQLMGCYPAIELIDIKYFLSFINFKLPLVTRLCS